MSNTQMSTLTPGELSLHQERVSVIHRYIENRLEAAAALRGIHDAKSYKATHDTFEAFARDEFGYSRSYANDLIAVGGIVENVRHAGQIKSIRQATEVAKAPPEMQQAVVEKATEIAEKTGKPVTAKTVAEARKAVMTTSEPDEEQYEDVDDEPETVEAKSVTKPEPTKAEQASKLRSVITQHNAAMMRAVDELQLLVPNKAKQDQSHCNFRSTHAIVNGDGNKIKAWK